MIRTDKHGRLTVGSDGLLRVDIRDLEGNAIDVESYEFRIELYGEKVMLDKPSERAFTDGGKFVISYDGEVRLNNVVIDGELYFVVDKYKLKPTDIYYSQYEFYDMDNIEETLQRASHGQLDFRIVYLDCPQDESQEVVVTTTAFRGDKGADFTYDDFTPEQLANLKGEKGETGDVNLMSFEVVDGELVATIPEGGNIVPALNGDGELIIEVIE